MAEHHDYSDKIAQRLDIPNHEAALIQTLVSYLIFTYSISSDDLLQHIQRYAQSKHRIQVVHDFFDSVGSQRSLEEYESVLPAHEIFYALVCYEFCINSGLIKDPIQFLDTIAKLLGFEWDIQERSYEKAA